MNGRELSFASLAEAAVGLTGIIVLSIFFSSGYWAFVPAFFLEGGFDPEVLFFLVSPVISVLLGFGLLIGRRPIARYLVKNDGDFGVSADSVMRIAVSILGIYLVVVGVVEVTRLTANFLFFGDFLDPGGSVVASSVQILLGFGLVTFSNRLSSAGLR